ncbi:protein BTG3 [Cynoglossus semilaevis]|uniref:B-cell translocation gene 3 n=1 Tax=Cynoglossus semilaevis TaxID=244447 RepID=A0A3P8W7U5_CYNSE|nr:protein BTG3-like [Cynoglossus semilaevis]
MIHTGNMRREIAAVVFYLKRLVKKAGKLEPDKVELFVERLAVALQDKFKGHWYPESPSKGQAYRCIRVNRFHREDPELLRACQESGIQYSDLGLPHELTLWVDPGEVCCRYGERSLCFSVATFSSDEEQDKYVAKKVISALTRVTSDYHSDSSSDEERTRTPPLMIDPSHCYKALNPGAPSWHPRKIVPGNCCIRPPPLHGFRPRSKAAHPRKHKPLVPLDSRAGPESCDSKGYC